MISLTVSMVLHDRTGTLVGSKQFQLTTGGKPVFKKSFLAASRSLNVDLLNTYTNTES